jgi:hypothetical protein
VSFFAKLIEINAPGTPIPQAYTGVGFRPKALIFFMDNRPNSGITTNAGTNSLLPMEILGFTDGTTEACMTNNDDYSAGNPFYIGHSIYIANPGGQIMRANIVSLDADGFTLDWTAIGTSDVSVLCLGGTDITGAKVLTWTGPVAPVGNVSTTGVGFRADGMMMVAGQSFASQGGVGVASGPTARGFVSSAYASGTSRYQRNDRVIGAVGGTQEIRFMADFVSFDADGFTLDWQAGESLATTFCAGLFLKGIQMKVGSLDEKTSNGAQAITGVGFTPKALLFLSTGITHNTGVVDGGLIDSMTGVATGPTERAAVELIDSTTTSAARREVTACITHTVNAGTTAGEADLTSFDADGFTLAWTNTDTVPRETIYMAFGASPSAPVVTDPYFVARPIKHSRGTTW